MTITTLKQTISTFLFGPKKRKAFTETDDNELNFQARVTHIAADTLEESPQPSSEPESIPSSERSLMALTPTSTQSGNASTPEVIEDFNLSFSSVSAPKKGSPSIIPGEKQDLINQLKKDIKNLNKERATTIKSAEKSKSNDPNDTIHSIRQLYLQSIQGQINTKNQEIHSILEPFYHPKN